MTPFATNNYLKVLVDDKEATLEQLNMLCGMKHDIFSRVRIPRKCLHVEALDNKIDNDRKAK
jgi:hypothetical protein